jgi:tagatose 1,6-diphosphate aldolase
MTTGITAGKRRGLEAVADSRGVIAALAIDQRGATRSLFAKAMGVGSAGVPGEMLLTFKEAVSRTLTPHASAILLDPEDGRPAAKPRAKSAGLLLAYEQTGYDKQVWGRVPRLSEGWTVQRLVEAGADGVKLLLYYSTVSYAEINFAKHEFVRRVGAECAEADVPFFLELVSYGEGREDGSVEFAAVKPEVVARSMAEFSKPEYRVDVLQVGVPVNMSFLEGSPSAGNEILYSREEAVDYYRRAAEQARVPFIYLSQGVNNETFQYALELATEAEVNFSGVLCGRATWQDGVAVFVERGLTALEDWLHSEGARNIGNVNQYLQGAQPWFAMNEQSHLEKR